MTEYTASRIKSLISFTRLFKALWFFKYLHFALFISVTTYFRKWDTAVRVNWSKNKRFVSSRFHVILHMTKSKQAPIWEKKLFTFEKYQFPSFSCFWHHGSYKVVHFLKGNNWLPSIWSIDIAFTGATPQLTLSLLDAFPIDSGCYSSL